MIELIASYDPLQYLLFFFVKEDGWSENLRLQNNQDRACTKVSMAAYYTERVHFNDKLSTLHLVVAFFTNISSTLLLKHIITLLTFWC